MKEIIVLTVSTSHTNKSTTAVTPRVARLVTFRMLTPASWFRMTLNYIWAIRPSIANFLSYAGIKNESNFKWNEITSLKQQRLWFSSIGEFQSDARTSFFKDTGGLFAGSSNYGTSEPRPAELECERAMLCKECMHDPDTYFLPGCSVLEQTNPVQQSSWFSQLLRKPEQLVACNWLLFQSSIS